MVDPASTPQVVQQHLPSWFDWITVTAILVGPILALSAQRLLDHLRENKKRRVNLYLTIMSLRSVWLNFESFRAHNSIDTIFDTKKDKPVREAWSSVIAHASTERPQTREGVVLPPQELEAIQRRQKAWDDRLLDLRVDLYQLLGAAVGYNHSVDYIKTHIYKPQHYDEVEMELMQIRRQLVKVLSNEGLKVTFTPQ